MTRSTGGGRLRSRATVAERAAVNHSERINRYFDRMIEAVHAMTDEQEAEFRAWRDLPSSVCNHDWPGWIPLIGVSPGRPHPTVISIGRRVSA